MQSIRIRLRIFMIPERPEIEILPFGYSPIIPNKIRMLLCF
ncbi:Uncharacterized protein dnm_055500 [Desulfonema magnum]|uniref:Uncharacterized protein n=1 Tax=Desulfonema magnum TaxID=45655 RepID=A0A975BPI5_9BACT|nr:Uncharacterized protein dnm_055500 [Desulfonema magnum]